MKKLGITIRIGAAYDSVSTDDGTVFDRSRMSRPEKRKLARLVSGIYDRHIKQGMNG